MVNIVRFPFLDYKSQVAFKIGSRNYDNVTLNNYLGGTMHANETQYKGLKILSNKCPIFTFVVG